MSKVGSEILCVTSDPGLRRVLRRTVGPLGRELMFAEHLRDLDHLPDPGPRLLIADLTTQNAQEVKPTLNARGWSPRLLALASWVEHGDALLMLDLCQCENIMARSATVDEAELLVSALKLLGSGDIFGIDKYLTWGVTVRQITIRTYDEKRAAIERVAQFAEEVGCRRRLTGKVEIVLDELLMNALYDAPAAGCGDRNAFVARAVPGGGPVSDREVELSYGCDGRFLALGVRDSYGALEPKTVLDHLARAISQSGTPLTSPDRGAGLGLYFILSSVSRFVVNIQPGRTTEAISLFDLRETGASPLATSFNIFTASDEQPMGASC